jgi:colanic acid/amylovoran biosynthesis glycosyltransferase
MSANGRHLAYVLKRFPRISETFVAAELIELERQGERVTVYAVSKPAEAFSHGFVDELRAEVIYLPYRPIRQPARVAGALLRQARRRPGPWLRAAREGLRRPSVGSWRMLLQATVLRDEMERAGIDHAHAHFATSAADLASLVWHMDGPSYSVTAHAKDIWHEQVRSEDLRRKLGHAAFVATVSEQNRSYLSSILAGDGARVRVVPNSVDLRRMGEPGVREPEPMLVVSVARLVEKKGLDDLVAACGIVRARGLPVRLEIAGDGPLREQLAAAAASAGLGEVLRGALPHEQVRDLFRRATVFCLPCVVASSGDRDGLPTSVLEAMALGVPVVTTDVNGLTETVIDGETGLVVPEHDPASLADALERVLGDPELAARLSAQARTHVQQGFSLEQSVQTLRSLFPGPR